MFEKNPDREFFIEQLVPADWMYPHLVPHGFILRIDRKSLPQLSPEIIARDTDFWTQRIEPLIGNWLREETSVQEVCAFTERTFVRRDLTGYKGDRQFVETAWPWHHAPEHIGASVFIGHCRAMIADVYAWRARQANTVEERERMVRAADFAFRQALALCPYERESVFRYVNLLSSLQRTEDARSIIGVAVQISPAVFRHLERQFAKKAAP